MTYSNRTLTFELAMKTMPSLWPQITNKIYNALHGKAVQVILDEEPSHYFYGRVTVESAARSQKMCIRDRRIATQEDFDKF